MFDAMISGAWRQTLMMQAMDVVADNVANVNTPGFKSTLLLVSGATGDGTVQVEHARDARPGEMSTTGNPLDFAIQGEGYFAVETPLGARYTRNGRFTMDAQGQIVTSQGHPVLGTGGAPLVVPPEAEGPVRVTADGIVKAGEEEIGALGVVRFENERDMKRVGGNLLVTDERPLPSEAKIIQGAVEGSNVEPIFEITRMMDVMRSFQSASKMVESEHERERRALQVLARVS